jgi:TonB-dependent receptor
MPVVLGTPPRASAQSPESGSLVGRVFNPVSKEYVRDAEIQVAGSDHVTVSEAGGYYRFSSLPAGPVELIVKYAGFEPVRASTSIEAGKPATLDISLVGQASSQEKVLNLEAFVVNAEASGNAKALMKQRNSMDLGMSIASDVFGDVTEGNVGEFLKYLPGIEMEYVEADTRGPRLGGMNPEYTGVSLDGMKLASADGFIQYGGTENGSAGGASRAFGFEQVSINSIESIEISRVTPSNLDADAPAGTINLKPRRPSDREGQLFSWSASVGLNSEELTLSRTRGPGDKPSRKVRPTYSLNYADSFFNKRLGILIGYSVSNLYNEQYRVQPTINRTPTATDTRPQVITSLQLKDGPKWTERRTLTASLDYKVTPDLYVALTFTKNNYEADIYNRLTTVNFAANGTGATNGRQLVGGDGVTTLVAGSTIAAANRSVASGGGNINKQTKGYTLSPKFEYRRGDLLVEGQLSHSESDNSYGTLRNGMAGNAVTNALSGIQMTATQSSPTAGDFQIVQTAGPDWTNLANYSTPRITDDVRAVYSEINVATLNLSYIIEGRARTVVRAGLKAQENVFKADRTAALYNFTYTGAANFAAYPSTFLFEPRALGVSFQSVNGGGAPIYADRESLGLLYQTSPQLFTRTVTPDNYFNANFADSRRMHEFIPAAYVMASSRIGPWSVQGGVRWEKTETESTEWDPLPVSQVAAAGYTVNTGTGRATTVPGLDYQYRTNPRVKRSGEYANYFPSISAKYRFSEDLIADIGAGKTIRRPEVNQLSGLFTINELSQEIRASNPNLKPENADRLAASMSYYFGRASNLTATVSHTKIKNFFVEDELTAEEYGLTDPEFVDYTVITRVNGEGTATYRSLELSYRHNLDFLPDMFKRTTVFATYTRTYSDQRRPGLTPHVLTGGFDYRYKRLGFGLRGVWADESPWTNVVGRYRTSNLKVDGNFEFRFSPKVQFFVQARNITGTNHTILEEINGNAPMIWRVENYGSNYVIGVRGQF